MSKQLLSTKSACEFLSVSRTTLYKLIHTGQLRAHFFAKAWKFRPADLEAYLDRMAVGRG
jgi:excisionase family DNA binding protein